LDNRLEKAQHLSKSKQSKPRWTLSKVSSGRTVTEDENFLKIKELREQSKGKAKSGINRKNNSIKREGKIVNQNIKKQTLKDSKLTQN
jgi:predicted RNA-binding protein with PUA-like domain